MSQRETLAYNGFVIGGIANANAYGLLSWSAADDNETRTVRAALSVKGTGSAPADVRTRLGLLRGLLQESSRSLAIAGGVNKTTTIDLTVSGSTVILTRTAGSMFANADLAMPIELAGVGAFQISKITSSSEVRCDVPSGVAVPAPAVGLTATIGNELIRCADFSKDLNAGSSAAGDPGDQVGGVMARGSVGRPSDIDDDGNRVRVEASWTFQRPALEVRPLSSGRIRTRISRTRTPEGLDAVRFTGTITAGPSGGSGYLVRGLISAAIDTWMATTLATLNSSATFEDVGGEADYFDDEGKVLSFDRFFVQKLFGDIATSGAGFDDPRLTGAEVSFTRQYQNVHGLSRGRQPFQVAVTYAAGVTATGANAVDFADLPGFWARTVKPYLAARARALFGGQVILMAGADPVYDPVASKIRASMTMLISRSGSNVYQYDRVTSMELDERFEFDELFDEKDFSAIYWTAGKALAGTVSVSVVQLGDPSANGAESGAGNSLAALPGGGVFFGGAGALSISIPSNFFDAGPSTEQPGKNSYVAYPDPGEPARLFPDIPIGSGSWLATRRRAAERVQYWGEDPDGVGSRVKVSSLQYIGSFVYIRDGERDDSPDSADATGGIGSGGMPSSTMTVERPETTGGGF